MGQNVSQHVKERKQRHERESKASSVKSSSFLTAKGASVDSKTPPLVGGGGSAAGCSSGPGSIQGVVVPPPAADEIIGAANAVGGLQQPAPPPFPLPMAPAQSTTVPCQYRTGRTLGSGTYAIVKEAIHIKTGEYFACKVINKKLMEGREYMVRNEIAVLKRISSGHPNIVTLHDYFETSHNLYLCFDLCTGGELFDSICARGQYTEADAAELVRNIFRAVKYIHDCGIVHRDLKPENLLFRSKPEKTEQIMIADFGLSRVMPENKLSQLTEICGTPGYMAPEIFKKTGHGKPVDVWAMGVIAYFLLAGYTPFDRENQRLEMEAILAGDFKFEPEEYWENVSKTAKDFVSECLTIDPQSRPTAEDCLNHPWLTAEQPHFVENETGQPKDLLPHVRKAFDARKTFRKAVLGMMAMKRMSTLAHHMSPEAQRLNEEVYNYKQESEKEVMEDMHVAYHHNADGSGHHHQQAHSRTHSEAKEAKRVDDISIDNPSETDKTLRSFDGQTPPGKKASEDAQSSPREGVAEELQKVSLEAKDQKARST